jgi:hypothetical protein
LRKFSLRNPYMTGFKHADIIPHMWQNAKIVYLTSVDEELVSWKSSRMLTMCIGHQLTQKTVAIIAKSRFIRRNFLSSNCNLRNGTKNNYAINVPTITEICKNYRSIMIIRRFLQQLQNFLIIIEVFEELYRRFQEMRNFPKIVVYIAIILLI